MGAQVVAQTLRLEPQLAEDLATVAAAEGRPVSEVARSAIERYILEQRRDPVFQKRLRQHFDRIRRLMPDTTGDGGRE